MFRRLVLLIGLALLFMGGCGTSIPQRWQNFKAYYNTYYNAKTSFDTGLEKNQNLELIVVEGRPVRMFYPPGQAGAAEFQNAIEKGADILRKHDKSDFVEPALLLIGKSYFFRSEFFSAQQKFGEIRRISVDPKLVQEAVLWEARTLFEMELYSQSVEFSEQQLLSIEDWDPEIEAQTALILAESHVSLGNFVTAIQLIDPSLPQIKDKDLKARGYFLLGQLLQFEGEYELASEAFEKVIKSKRAYELIYQSQKQQAISLRESGKTKESEEIFIRLIKDDKNIEVRPDLKVELARVYKESGEYEEALQLFDDVLHNPLQRPAKLAQAQSYYGIAEIYRDEYDDFISASFYYDSAAAISLSEQERPPDYDAKELASIFGEFATLSLEIMELDSLIKLAIMPKALRDSTINQIRNDRKLIYEEEQRRLGLEQDQLVVVDQEIQGQQMIPGLGFLNHLDQRRVDDAKIQFQALWLGRPLMDHWRRIEAVRSAPVNTDSQETPEIAFDSTDQNSIETTDPEELRNLSERDSSAAESILEVEETLFKEDPLDGVLGIQLSDIPIDSAARLEAKERYYQRNYELANLMTFSLNLSDKASKIYRLIADSSQNLQLRAQSLYVLTTLQNEQENEKQKLETAKELIQLNPQSIYAQRVSEDFNLDSLLNIYLELDLLQQENKGYRVIDSAQAEIKESVQIDTTRIDTSQIRFEEQVPKIGDRDSAQFSENFEDQIPELITLEILLESIFQNQPLKVEDEEVSVQQKANWLYFFAQNDSDVKRKPYLYYETASLFSRLALEAFEKSLQILYWEKVRSILNEFNTLFPSHELTERVKIILLDIPTDDSNNDTLNETLFDSNSVIKSDSIRNSESLQ